MKKLLLILGVCGGLQGCAYTQGVLENAAAMEVPEAQEQPQVAPQPIHTCRYNPATGKYQPYTGNGPYGTFLANTC